MLIFGGTGTRAYTRAQARGATPELRRVADTTPHGLFSGVGALWDCVPRVCGGGGGCTGGGVPLGAVPALLWCGEVSLGGKHIIGVSP